MTSAPTPEAYLGRSVVDPAGTKIGSVGQVYVNDESGVPDWITVNTGLFGMRENFVPLQGSSLNGDQLQVPFDKDVVTKAPTIDDDSHLDADEQDNLYAYYRPYLSGGERLPVTDAQSRPDSTDGRDRPVGADGPGSVAGVEEYSSDRTDVPESMAADAGSSAGSTGGGKSMAADAGTAPDRTGSGKSMAADAGYAEAGYATDRTDTGPEMAADAGEGSDNPGISHPAGADPSRPATGYPTTDYQGAESEDDYQGAESEGTDRQKVAGARLRKYVPTEK